jgi:hypothetical protein
LVCSLQLVKFPIISHSLQLDYKVATLPLNLLLRSVNDLATTTGVCRAKSKADTLSKRLDKPHSHPEQNFDLQLQALQ